MSEKLKPCPFCGCCCFRDEYEIEEGVTFVSYGCSNSDCVVPLRVTNDRSLWNARAESPEMRAIKRAIRLIVGARTSLVCDPERGAGLFHAQEILLKQLQDEGVTL